MKSTFCLSRDLQIILYGANRYSDELYRALTDAGYDVAAVFDRRYKTLRERYPVPVYGLEDHPFAGLDKTNFCVMIMLQNAMQHEGIAMELLRQGFHKILFVPMESRLEEESALALRYQYNRLISGQFQLLREIPLLSEEILRPELDAAHAVIRDEGAVQIVWCPAELLYTNPARLCKEPSVLRYANVPLCSYFPYVSLFEYLRGEGGESRQYLSEYGVNSCKYPTSLTDAQVIVQRKTLLEIYQNALNKGMDFFISSAPPAEWNAESRVFNLLEGQHRSLFLMTREFRYIPIRISREDFRAWARGRADETPAACLEKNRGRLSVLHPQYHRFSESADRGDLLQLESIQRYLGSGLNAERPLLEGKRVLDLSGTFGYYARSALRMRAERAALYAPEGVEAAEAAGALEGFRGIPAIDIWSSAGEAYHTLFVLGALADVPEEERPRWMDRCAALCREECFVSVGSAAELEQWRQRFFGARELRSLFSRGRPVRLWVLRK